MEGQEGQEGKGERREGKGGEREWRKEDFRLRLQCAKKKIKSLRSLWSQRSGLEMARGLLHAASFMNKVAVFRLSHKNNQCCGFSIL